MEILIPKTSTVFASLLRADLTTQWRNRRSLMLVLLLPTIILVSWKGLISRLGGELVLSSSITMGLVAMGLMGYSNSIARDRDKGIFQRLRVAPLPLWCIMGSRITVQLMMIILLTIIVFVAGFYIDHVTIQPVGYVLTFLTALVSGAMFLGIGQLIVGLIQNPETVNSTSRLIYALFVTVGMLGQIGVMGTQVQQITKWSPYGTVQNILEFGMKPGKWTADTSNKFLVTLGYAVVFSAIGIKKFKWSNK